MICGQHGRERRVFDGGEPDWVAQEREQFFKHRDKDSDKRLSRVSQKQRMTDKTMGEMK